MSEDAATRPLRDDEQALLAAVLDEIVPRDRDRGLPGAGQLGLAASVDEALRGTPPLRCMVVEGLDDLAAAARARDPQGFAALPAADRVALLEQQGFVLPLTLQVYTAYYRAPRVLETLGLEARAPHPQGHAMEPDDLTLLETVRRRPPSYRRA